MFRQRHSCRGRVCVLPGEQRTDIAHAALDEFSGIANLSPDGVLLPAGNSRNQVADFRFAVNV